MGTIPAWVIGALVLGVFFDLPAFWLAMAVIGAGVVSALLGT